MSRGALPEQSARTRGVAILDRLVAEGQVPPSLYDEVLMHAQRTESTAEEAILQLGLMTEGDLLKYVAGVYQTRFVGSDKLAKAGVDPKLLQQVPRKLAKRLLVFPILYDARTRTLSVVAADVTDDDVRQQMLFTTGARDVKIYVAREGAIRAAIAKHYDQDNRPFELLLSTAERRATCSVRWSALTLAGRSSGRHSMIHPASPTACSRLRPTTTRFSASSATVASARLRSTSACTRSVTASMAGFRVSASGS